MVGDTMFAVFEDDLLALDAGTGETIWRTTLRDKVTNGCPSCFAAAGGRLIVRTTDAYVTAFGTASSETLWSKRLTATNGSVSVAGDQLFIVDEAEDADQINPVALVDPATGRTIRSTAPTCPRDDRMPWELEMSPGIRCTPLPGSDDVVAAFGFGEQPASCGGTRPRAP